MTLYVRIKASLAFRRSVRSHTVNLYAGLT